MADGDDLVIGENNQAQSATQLVLGLGNPPTTLLRVGTGGGASIGVYGEGGTGIHGKGGNIGVSGEGAIGVLGTSKSQEGVNGQSKSGIGVSGSSVIGCWNSSLIRHRHRRPRKYWPAGPFEAPSKVGVLGESKDMVSASKDSSRILASSAAPFPGLVLTRKRTDALRRVRVGAERGRSQRRRRHGVVRVEVRIWHIREMLGRLCRLL